MNQRELLEDFKLRLTIKRSDLNRSRARMAAVSELAGCDDYETRLAARVDELLASQAGYEHLTDLWESSIMDAGGDYLQRHLHLRPASARNTTGRKCYVVDEDVRLEGSTATPTPGCARTRRGPSGCLARLSRLRSIRGCRCMVSVTRWPLGASSASSVGCLSPTESSRAGQSASARPVARPGTS